MAKPTIERAEVERLASLAQLELADHELQRITHDLGNILAYVGQLAEVDVSGVEPTAHVVLERLPLRPDVAEPSLSTERIMDQAPRHQSGGFAVPAFVDEG